MSNANSTFDVSVYNYPKNIGGLVQDTEATTISLFFYSFGSLNHNVKLSHEQLHQCWRHALYKEYKMLLTDITSMTQKEVDGAKKILSWAMKLQHTLPWYSMSRYDLSYEKFERYLNDEQPTKKQEQQISHPKKEKKKQDYDPLLLLQSLPEMRSYAEHLYQNGFKKFVTKQHCKDKSATRQKYKKICVEQACEHIKRLLRANYIKEEDENSINLPQSDEDAFQSGSGSYKWEKDPKWNSLWSQMKAERAQMVKDLGKCPVADQDPAMDIDTNLSKQNSDAKSTHLEDPGKSVPYRSSKRLKKSERKALKAMRKEEYDRASNIKYFSDDPKHPTSMIELSPKSKSHDLITSIADDFKNLLCNEEIPQDSLKLHRFSGKRMKRKAFRRMERARKERKNLMRREQLETGIVASCDKDKIPVSTLFSAQSLSTYVDRPESLDRRDGLSQESLCLRLVDEDKGLNTSIGPGVKTALENVALVVGFPSQSGRSEKAAAEAGNQVKQEDGRGDDMDIEMSKRIGTLEI